MEFIYGIKQGSLYGVYKHDGDTKACLLASDERQGVTEVFSRNNKVHIVKDITRITHNINNDFMGWLSSKVNVVEEQKEQDATSAKNVTWDDFIALDKKIKNLMESHGGWIKESDIFDDDGSPTIYYSMKL